MTARFPMWQAAENADKHTSLVAHFGINPRARGVTTSQRVRYCPARLALRTLLILNLALSALACLTLRHPRSRFALRECFRTKLFTENQLLARNKASRDMRPGVKVLVTAKAEAEAARYRVQIEGLDACHSASRQLN